MVFWLKVLFRFSKRGRVLFRVEVFGVITNFYFYIFSLQIDVVSAHLFSVLEKQSTKKRERQFFAFDSNGVFFLLHKIEYIHHQEYHPLGCIHLLFFFYKAQFG